MINLIIIKKNTQNTHTHYTNLNQQVKFTCKNCSHECAYGCAQLWCTMQHRTVLMISFFILQTIITAQMSIGEQWEVHHSYTVQTDMKPNAECRIPDVLMLWYLCCSTKEFACSAGERSSQMLTDRLFAELISLTF